jgi:hypothetical protein
LVCGFKTAGLNRPPFYDLHLLNHRGIIQYSEFWVDIWQQKLKGGPPKQITNFTSGLIFYFDRSRDGRQMALARGSQSSDVILINNFR